MSSMHRNSANPSESTTKKKFGKNLNKQLSKPPAPPIAGSGPGGRGSTSSSSRNGLLLLSTKRSSSTGNAAASGMLSSKTTTSPSKPQQPLGLTTESYSSAHDALLGAVIGASRMTDTQQPPDAWGVAEKQTSSASESDGARAPALAPKGGVSSGVSSYQPAEHGRTDANHAQYSSDARGLTRDDGDGDRYEHSKKSPAEGGDTQGSYMSQLARDRAEKKRAEEENRINEQKDRAAQRLRELEKKMSTEKQKDGCPVPLGAAQSSPETRENQYVQHITHDGPQGAYKGTNSDRSGERVARTLFDPDRPYSSSVGGKAQINEQESSAEERQNGSAGPKNGRSAAASKSPQLRAGDNQHEQPSVPMIHLSSYEDRDRGERNSNAGPRMLFDPKSGSMVAVSSRDDGTSGGRGKKGNKAKGRKDRDNGTSAREKSEGSASADGGLSTMKSKRSKGRKDDVPCQRRERKRSEDNDVSLKEESKTVKGRAGKVPPAENRLPRTCGVLYVRDEHGNCYCADGCDGDQGYGSHSVRGGRVRNPVEYAKFMEQQESYQQEDATGLEAATSEYGNGMGGVGYEDDHAYYGTQDSAYDSLRNAPNRHESQMSEKDIDWVKPNEKIELVTGANDSPTLQATASPWAPSHAALAAAAASKAREMASANLRVDHENATDDEDSDDDDHPSFVGLGFDPTENMDAVMKSPSMLASSPDRLESVALSALALDAPRSSEPTSRNLFAFGSSSTWGTGSAETDWAMLGTGPGSSSSVGNSGQEKPVGAASFLSLSTGNPWGAPGLSAFGGTTMSGTRSGGQGASSTGD